MSRAVRLTPVGLLLTVNLGSVFAAMCGQGEGWLTVAMLAGGAVAFYLGVFFK